ncbi:MAG TPA: fatty acid desaturase [Steroidobacteraceae bacterium]|nr:fatty acid desaturase [Steroidobacteraceae bacterium]
MSATSSPETAACAALAPDKSRFKLQKLLQPFAADRGIAAPILWFFLDWLVLGAAIATMLVVDSWWVTVFASLVAALWIARLFVIGHDACHGAYTRHDLLNQWIGRIAFLPSLTPYSLWELGHNLAHHGWTNLKGRDYVWTPYSPLEFARLPWVRRQLERVYRSGVGQGIYYMIELWWKKLYFPNRKHVGHRRVSYIADCLLVSGFAVIWIGGLVIWGHYSGKSVASLLIFGFALPFFVWNCLMGFVIYVQHTHPRVPWYDRREEWSANAGYATTTVHVKLRRPFDGLIHYILEHGAHHVNMGIPLYRLKAAQARLSATLDERLKSEVFSWRYYWNTVRRCKLYDFAQHVWMDFDGHITSAPLVSR